MNQRVLHTRRGAIALLESGPTEAPPLLCVHGWLDNAASFKPLARHIQRRRLMAIDLPGHGHSTHRAPGHWYHYIDFVADLDAVSEALGLESFDLMGHSLGGAVCCAFAAARPRRVRKLVLIEGLGPLSTPAGETAANLGEALQSLAEFGEREPRVYPDKAAVIRARQQKGGLSEAAATLLVERALEQVDDGETAGWRWRSDRRLRLRSPQRLTEAQVLDLLGNIRCPVLNIYAEPPTPLLSGPLARRRIEAIDDIRDFSLPGHHHLHMQSPEPIAAAVNTFLENTR